MLPQGSAATARSVGNIVHVYDGQCPPFVLRHLETVAGLDEVIVTSHLVSNGAFGVEPAHQNTTSLARSP
jgi:hypothetical protein